MTTYESEGGHQPQIEAQVRAAHVQLIGVIRRGVMLVLYTGQRGCEMVRLRP